MKFFGTNNFLENIKKLCKKKKDNYYTVKDDICDEYKDITDINEAILKGIPVSEVKEEDKKVILKTRYKNSAMKEGKSSGFRSYSVADTESENLTFLSVYPKKGKFGKSDLTAKEVESSLEEYIEQKSDDTLSELDINNNLKFKEKD